MQLCKKKSSHYYNDRVVPQDLITCTFRRKHFIFSVTETSGDFPSILTQFHSAFKIPFCVTQTCKVACRDSGNLEILLLDLKNVLLLLNLCSLRGRLGEPFMYCYDEVNTLGNVFKQETRLANRSH